MSVSEGKFSVKSAKMQKRQDCDINIFPIVSKGHTMGSEMPLIFW